MAVNHKPSGETVTRIYLCGSVKKGQTDNRPINEFWTDQNEAFIMEHVRGEVEILNPSKTNINRQDYFTNFGCDMFLLQSSDLMIVDLRSEKGIGVGAELMHARHNNIPVAAWLPADSYYKRDLFDVFGEDLRNWIHPFAFALSDFIGETLLEVCEKVNEVLAGNVPRIDSHKSIANAVRKFEQQYPELTNWQNQSGG